MAGALRGMIASKQGAAIATTGPKPFGQWQVQDPITMHDQARSELAPHGVLRAGINMGNPLLVTGRMPDGDPDGVSPDMARAIAAELGVPVKLVRFARPSELADAVATDAWDICLIGAEPQRAAKIDFTPAYVEIEATYLVSAASTVQGVDELDRAGTRIAVMDGSAFGLWLDRNIKHAELVRTAAIAGGLELFKEGKVDALAGLRTGLTADAKTVPGARVLDGRFMAVQQALGTERKNAAGAAFLRRFVQEAKASGLVASLIAKHKADGLTVAVDA